MQRDHSQTRPYRWATLIPNTLTILRIAIAAIFPFAAPVWRIPLVLVAGVSDSLDGWIARRFRLTSWVGALLDGIADKALTLSVLLTFTLEGSLAWWQLVLVMTRDVAVTAIAVYLAWNRAWPEFTRMSARMPGKVTTVAIYLLMAALLLAPGYAWIAVWPTAILSVLAAVDYVLIVLSVDVKRR
jgi:phosphatidylglycerophosphate synthase